MRDDDADPASEEADVDAAVEPTLDGGKPARDGDAEGDTPNDDPTPPARDATTPANDPRRDGGAAQRDAQTPSTGGDPSARPDGFHALERLDRGLTVVRTAEGNYLGWRLLGHEYGGASKLVFRVLRGGMQVAEVSDSTNYFDRAAPADATYEVQTVRDGAVVTTEKATLLLEREYLRIPLQRPAAGTTPASPKCEVGNESFTYAPNDASAGDLDGDGRYELILKWDPSNSKDNSQSGCTGPVIVDSYSLDGKRLWRIDLGPNIRAGAHYTQFIVYDLDGDGKAEVSLKTAPGTRDGTGAYLSQGPAANDDDRADYRSASNPGGRSGYVLTGPEYLTVFDGATGKERATVAFVPGRGSVASWGDDYGNRVDRFLAGVAYLDQSGLPSLIMARGYYTRAAITAWSFREGALRELWRFDTNSTARSADGKPFTGQGCHSLSIANVDSDPQQEIIYGAMTVDHDGKGMCSTGFGHGDALHVSDLLPSRPGLEVFMPHEDSSQPSYDLHDARTCEVLVRGAVTGKDTGRGVAADISKSTPGAELWASGTGLMDSGGRAAGAVPSSTNFLVYWDDDALRELLDQTEIQKYGGARLARCSECRAGNGTKATPALVADLFGDHREEVIWGEADASALRIYTTTTVSRMRMYTLMHDAQYRVAVAWQNVAYNQPPHLSFSLADGTPPTPSLRYTRP